MQDETIKGAGLTHEPQNETQQILLEVFAALEQKGYNLVNQMSGYLISGDPTYITSFDNSRGKITRISRDEIMEELIECFLKHYGLNQTNEDKQ